MPFSVGKQLFEPKAAMPASSHDSNLATVFPGQSDANSTRPVANKQTQYE